MPPAPPRLFCIAATTAPVVAVLRRGPTDWWHVGRWDLGGPRYEPGAWFHGHLYPQKCDLSPDGRWLAYSAMKLGSTWAAGDIYEAISRLPWLTALAAWEAGTTYTRGIHFVAVPGTNEVGTPDVGDVGPCLQRYGLAITRPIQFPVERRRSWTEDADAPPREAGGAWDEARSVTMTRLRPGSADTRLHASGSYAAFRDNPAGREAPEYAVTTEGELHVLDAVQWADWDEGGRLLVATADGRLQIRAFPSGNVLWEHDLAGMTPAAAPPPEWASEW